LAVTHRCNLRCVWCSADKMMAAAARRGLAELSPVEIGELARQATALGAIHFNLTGGEPTTKPPGELVGIVERISRHGALVSMVTNCVTIKAVDLARYTWAGLDTIQLSLESLDPAGHDAIRRAPGNHRAVMRVLGWAQALRLNIVLSMVLHAGNFDEACRMADFAREWGAMLLVNPLSVSGANTGDGLPGIRGRKAEYDALLDLPWVRSDTSVSWRGGRGCPAGVERLYVTPYGEVLTCPHVQVSYGNLRAEPLAAIHRRTALVFKRPSRDCRHVFDDDYIRRVVAPTWTADELPAKAVS